MATTKEFATVRTRLRPSTHRFLTLISARSHEKLTISDVVDELRAKARLFDRSVKAGKLITK